jgi:hypothetical protein
MSIGIGIGRGRSAGRSIGDDDGGLAMAVIASAEPETIVPEPEYTSAMDFARYAGLMVVVAGACVAMAACEVASEIRRLWQGKGTLWK